MTKTKTGVGIYYRKRSWSKSWSCRLLWNTTKAGVAVYYRKRSWHLTLKMQVQFSTIKHKEQVTSEPPLHMQNQSCLPVTLHIKVLFSCQSIHAQSCLPVALHIKVLFSCQIIWAKVPFSCPIIWAKDRFPAKSLGNNNLGANHFIQASRFGRYQLNPAIKGQA